MQTKADEITHQIVTGSAVGIAAATLLGVAIMLLLASAVVYGIRVARARADKPPLPPPDQPRSGAWHTREELDFPTEATDHGPGHQDAPLVGHFEEQREADEVPRDGRRRMPYEIKSYGTRSHQEPEPPAQEQPSAGHTAEGRTTEDGPLNSPSA